MRLRKCIATTITTGKKMSLSDSIQHLLLKHQIPYSLVSHTETLTSEASAKARNDDPKNGGKALFIKSKFKDPISKEPYYSFCICVISSVRSLDTKQLKKQFKAQSIAFASTEELEQLTGLTKGCLPPFGKNTFPNHLPFDLYVDTSITQNEKIGFNAGSLTSSIIMSVKDYLPTSKPTAIFNFSK